MRHPILVVQDEQSTRDRIVEVLDNEGFFGIPGASGEEALQYLQSGGGASAILLDELAGWTAFRRAQVRNAKLAHIPVIAMSPLEGPSAVYAVPRGARGASIDIEALIAILRRLCRQS